MANVGRALSTAITIIVITLVMANVIQLVHTNVTSTVPSNQRDENSWLAPVWNALGAGTSGNTGDGLVPTAVYVIIIGAIISLIMLGIGLFSGAAGKGRTFRR